jgi:hypothetical protein
VIQLSIGCICYFEQEEYESSLNDANKLIEIAEKDAAGYWYKAKALLELSQIDQC